MDSSAPEVSEVLEIGTDSAGVYRRVRFTDGTEATQRPVATVEGTVTHADGTTTQAEIKDVTLHVNEED